MTDIKFENRAKKLAEAVVRARELRAEINEITAPLAKKLDKLDQKRGDLINEIESMAVEQRAALQEMEKVEKEMRAELAELATDRKLSNYRSYLGGVTISTTTRKSVNITDYTLIPEEYMVPVERRFNMSALTKVAGQVPGTEPKDIISVRVLA